jgi:iron complex outermembrane receptor protein
MRGSIRTKIIQQTFKSTLLAGLALGLIPFAGSNALAQGSAILEEIVVTATRREESLQDVPISVATMSGERLNSLFTGGEDVLALANRVPGLYAESSNGRAAPRFYLRGLGNIDFDLAASQPVSIVMDEVVMENVVLKSFPLFDLQNVEIIRGPQGTLFGRNTTAGIIKINTRRPEHESSGYISGSLGTYTTGNLEAAYGGSLSDNTAGRISFLYRTRDNWISNGFTGEKDVMGEFEEIAGRVQLLWSPNDDFEALVSLQARSMEGTSSMFRANVFTTGSNELNQNFDRDTVYFDGGDNNPQSYDAFGATLTLDWDLANTTLTSITSFQDADGSSRGDIDGGVVDHSMTASVPPGITSDPAAPALLFGFPAPALTFPGTIYVPSVTEDGAETDQFTQEFRLASDTTGPFSWQVGAFYFDSELQVTTDSFASGGFLDPTAPPQHTMVTHENTAWAVFGQGSYDVSDRLTLTAGVRYTDDEKDYRVDQFGQLWIDSGIVGDPCCIAPVLPINVQDDETSWEVSANFAATDSSAWYGRISSGFRAQTIQGRDVAFLERPTVAVPETITSYEVGYKADLANNRLRLNAAVFYYTIDDMQLSIIGGTGNSQQVINAKEGEATGLEVDLEWLATDNLMFTLGFAFNDTEINDPALATTPCAFNNGFGGSGCTPTQPADPSDPTKVLIHGMPFPRVPESSWNFSARWGAPVGSNGEIFVFTDWAFQGESVMPLYESIEFDLDSQFEGGLKIGYRDLEDNWELALFGRNITDEENVRGFIDFSNLTGFVNEPAIWGLEGRVDFGD